MRINYMGALAWKYDREIYVTLITPQTLKHLGKSDPLIDDIIPLSFTLPGFIWFLQDDSYHFLGKADCTMNDVLDKFEKDFAEFLLDEE